MTAPNLSASQIIAALALNPHPEGGYYKETYRSPEQVKREALPERFDGGRSFCTGIYYLLEAGDFSAFHRIKSDEMWHFYGGGPLELHLLHNGAHIQVFIGPDVIKGHYPQFVVPAGAWFASRPAVKAAYSFVGCTVSPGFDFADFEMARREVLIEEYRGQESMIRSLTRE